MDHLPAGDFIHAIRGLLSPRATSEVSLAYISRNANAVAHTLSKMGSKCSAHQVWFNDIPHQLYSNVLSDRMK